MVKRPILIFLLFVQIALISTSVIDYSHDQGEPLSIKQDHYLQEEVSFLMVTQD